MEINKSILFLMLKRGGTRPNLPLTSREHATSSPRIPAGYFTIIAINFFFQIKWTTLMTLQKYLEKIQQYYKLLKHPNNVVFTPAAI